MADGKTTDRKLVDPDEGAPTVVDMRRAKRDLEMKLKAEIEAFEHQYRVTVDHIVLERPNTPLAVQIPLKSVRITAIV